MMMIDDDQHPASPSARIHHHLQHPPSPSVPGRIHPHHYQMLQVQVKSAMRAVQSSTMVRFNSASAVQCSHRRNLSFTFNGKY